ncbi:L-serine ammonia-lyase, iron-sulfur-dependent, subunit alpha [Petroclostridium sp. X23]|uniref:L-serine ammonia-lyase, iron-sulfur-dependent, subunit alpha n=1 Tax=Petroclostridium sp. X23 TaxID=3045146 RepID=UPI0024ADB0D3|nr:L-serine ammonia-lyase, iron-sulfur-dependent, subunit alpha [Petroclostridium sp. X23]WHH60454.1 L-serine ammonia-lyase, iron-sulfur-dependent, subunit alpha [Petroclostridium sp. X23]
MTLSNAFDVFDIIGPVMIGPSSSHTAGAVRIGLAAGQLCDHNPKEITVLFHGSLASTYSTHKTDVGVVAGIMNIGVDDEKIRDAVCIAEDKGIKIKFDKIELQNAHPSTIIIELTDQQGNKQVMRSATIGGGNIFIEQINGYNVELDGKQDCFVGITSIREKEEFAAKFIALFGNKAEVTKFDPWGEGYSFKVECGESIREIGLEKAKQALEASEIFRIHSVMSLSIQGKEFYKSCRELAEKSKEEGCLISDTVIKYEAEKSGRTTEQVTGQMRQTYHVMRASIKKGLEKENILLGNIFKGNAAKMDRFLNSKRSICGTTVSKVIRNALAVMEVNGSMGKVVACPTAGSAGTVPAAVLTIAECNDISDEKVIQSLFTGAGIGIVIAENATISGAVGGCQAECGAASAIAAAVITEMFGGSYEDILSAVSLALGNILGMVCDPVAGMVELPCIQRNAIAAMNAIISAEMALAGINSVIPADEMIGALDEVGKLMHCSLKDTLGAGISNTPTARKIEQDFFGIKKE